MLRPHALLAALATIAALALGGCASTGTEGVSPGDGPAASDTPTEATEGENATDQPTDEATEEHAPANFHEKYTYRDGLQVEVIRINLGHFTRAQLDRGLPDKEKAGDPYVEFTVRIRNGTKKTLQLAGDATVTYGPDGVAAKQSNVFDPTGGGLTGKLIPTKSRSAAATYLIPEKWYGDVVLEFSPDLDHDSAVFAGSIK